MIRRSASPAPPVPLRKSHSANFALPILLRQPRSASSALPVSLRQPRSASLAPPVSLCQTGGARLAERIWRSETGVRGWQSDIGGAQLVERSRLTGSGFPILIALRCIMFGSGVQLLIALCGSCLAAAFRFVISFFVVVIRLVLTAVRR